MSGNASLPLLFFMFMVGLHHQKKKSNRWTRARHNAAVSLSSEVSFVIKWNLTWNIWRLGERHESNVRQRALRNRIRMHAIRVWWVPSSQFSTTTYAQKDALGLGRHRRLMQALARPMYSRPWSWPSCIKAPSQCKPQNSIFNWRRGMLSYFKSTADSFFFLVRSILKQWIFERWNVKKIGRVLGSEGGE